MPASLDKARKSLRERYVRGLSSKLQALRAARKSLGDRESGAETTIRRLAHQLRGSGASYGLPEITDAAGLVEDAPASGLDAALDGLVAVIERVRDERRATGRILVVEDDERIYGVVQGALSGPHWVLVHAHTISEAQKLLWAQPFDLVLLDLRLPDGDGRDLLAALKRRAATAELPVVALSARPESHVKSECMALGVELFIEKPIDTDYLVTIVAEVIKRQTARGGESGYDPLTGLKSRESFEEAFRHVLAFCRRTRIPLSLAVLDIDGFSAINQEFGAAAGDEVLVSVAGTIVTSLREEDFTGRWDDDQFVIGLLGAREEDALFALGRIRGALDQEGILLGESPGPVYISVSGGVVDVAQDEEFHEALARARQLVRRIKQSGHGRVVRPTTELGPQRRRVLVIEEDLEIARLLCAMFEADDCEVTLCENGKFGLEAADDHDYDLVIIDRLLPDMDGFDLLAELRSQPHYGDVPLLVLTASGDGEQVEQAFELGADDHVELPFNPRALRARLRRHLERRARRAPAGG